jgi:hypothetical protein
MKGEAAYGKASDVRSGEGSLRPAVQVIRRMS